MARTPRPFAVLGFGSTHAALDAEALLMDLGIDVVPIPAPKELGALCGIALRLELADEERAMRYLESAGMEPKSRLELEDI
jgi:hypothetical protein